MLEVKVYFNGEPHLEYLLIEEHRLSNRESITAEVIDEFGAYWDYWEINHKEENIIVEYNDHSSE